MESPGSIFESNTASLIATPVDTTRYMHQGNNKVGRNSCIYFSKFAKIRLPIPTPNRFH